MDEMNDSTSTEFGRVCDAKFTISIPSEEMDNILVAGSTIQMVFYDTFTYRNDSCNLQCHQQKAVLDEKYKHVVSVLRLTKPNIETISIKDAIQMLIDIQYTPCDDHHFLEVFESKYHPQFGSYFLVYFGS
jgi:hypothetical protein